MGAIEVYFDSFITSLRNFYLLNSAETYLFVLFMFFALFLVFYFVNKIVLGLLSNVSKKTENIWDDAFVGFLKELNQPFFAFLAFYFAYQILIIPPFIDSIITVILLIIVWLFVGNAASHIVGHVFNRKLRRKKERNDPQNISMIRMLSFFIRLGVWMILFIFVLLHFGVEITPIITGLGIIGLAVALALQTILADLFNALAIYIDKPFVEGDFIIVGSDKGTVQSIGLKTTRIKALEGHELVFSNTDLTSARINNYKKMQRRRVVVSFGVEYSTPNRKMKKVRGIVEDIFKQMNKKRSEEEKIVLDRVHFNTFADSSLNFEMVYFLPTSDYLIHMNILEDFNLRLKEAFEKEGIVFAFPTRTLHIEGSLK